MLKRVTGVAIAAAIGVFALTSTAQADPYLQCVTFVRMITHIQLFGDAWTWWEKATGKYAKGKTPQSGAVLVFRPTGHMRRGHVAVVDQVLNDRIIQINHANWSPIDGRRGRVEQDVTVIDVSASNDWTSVKVWYNPLGDMGHTVYPTYGFIYQAPEKAAVVADAGPGQGPLQAAPVQH